MYENKLDWGSLILQMPQNCKKIGLRLSNESEAIFTSRGFPCDSTAFCNIWLFVCQRSRASRVRWKGRYTTTARSSSRTAVNCAHVRTASTHARRSVPRNCGLRRQCTVNRRSWWSSRGSAAVSGSVHTRSIYRDPTTNTTSDQVHFVHRSARIDNSDFIDIDFCRFSQSHRQGRIKISWCGKHLTV